MSSWDLGVGWNLFALDVRESSNKEDAGLYRDDTLAVFMGCLGRKNFSIRKKVIKFFFFLKSLLLTCKLKLTWREYLEYTVALKKHDCLFDFKYKQDCVT